MELASDMGLESWLDSTGNAYAALAGREASVLLVGHIDTVEGFIEPNWNGEWISGRGAVDAKASLASMLTALHLLGRRDCPVALVALVGEEGDSRGAWSLIERGAVPSYVVIGEPTGSRRVAVGYRGSAKILIECRGEGGHPSTPWGGGSALDRMLDIVNALRKASGRGPREPSYTVVRLSAGSSENKIPEHAVAVVDVRIPIGGSVESTLKLVYEECSRRGCRARLMGIPTSPIRVKPQSTVPRLLVRALLSLGLKPRLSEKPGTSDMNILASRASSIAAYGPGDPSLSHTDRERVSIGELDLAVRVYKNFLLEACEKYAPKSDTVTLPS